MQLRTMCSMHHGWYHVAHSEQINLQNIEHTEEPRSFQLPWSTGVTPGSRERERENHLKKTASPEADAHMQQLEEVLWM